MICENCRKEFFPIDKYHQRFCCNECARSFSSKFNKGRIKIVVCKDCGKSMELPINSPKKLCDECQAKEYSNEYIKTHKYKKIYSFFNVCRICGKVKNDGCKFCQNYNIKQIHSLVNRTDFDPGKIGTPEIFDEVDRVRQDVSKFYNDDKKSCVEIGYIYHDRCPGNFGNVLRYLDIKRREFHDSSVNSILTGRRQLPSETPNSRYKSGYHTTWDGTRVYFRSSYELDYAIELDNDQIHYEVETLHIPYISSVDNREHVAIPDFYIPSKNMIVEIKSEYTLNAQQMRDKFAEYKALGYKTKLIVDHIERNIDEI